MKNKNMPVGLNNLYQASYNGHIIRSGFFYLVTNHEMIKWQTDIYFNLLGYVNI